MAQKIETIDYTYSRKPSFLVKTLEWGAQTFVSKNLISKKLKDSKFEDKYAKIQKKYFKKFSITSTVVQGRIVHRFTSKQINSKKAILFIHGGGYIFNCYKQHWDFVAKIVELTNCTVIVPDYPLAPTNTYKESYEMVETVYSQLLNEFGATNLTLMGDSAGGGFSLALCMKNVKVNQTQPHQLILIAPWLDIQLLNPDIASYEKDDATLDVKNLIIAGKKWAGNLETSNYLLSPIYGDLSGLPKTSVFVGSHDILIADCKKFKKLMEANSTPINYYEYPKLFHDWVMLVRLREAKDALSKIAELINKK